MAIGGPYARSTFMLSFAVPPPGKKIGIVIPTYTFVGEEASALLTAFFGKFVSNAGHMQAGEHLTVPAMWSGACHAYAKAPFNARPRRPNGPALELQAAFGLIKAYFYRAEEDPKLAAILRSAEFYRMALENYHERPEMSFALLITSIESLTSLIDYTDDDLYDDNLRSDFAAIEAHNAEGHKIVARLKGRLYQVRRKVSHLVDTFVPDSFFHEREASVAFGVILDRNELRERILAAYDIRSRLLHTGNRAGIWYLAHDEQGMEYGAGKPTIKDKELVELLCSSLNLVGLERVASTVLRTAIERWLKPQTPVTS